MRARLGWTPVAAVFALGACNLPERDNVHDPQNDPIARLRIGVLAPGATTPDFQTQDGGRATTFVLDASASEDPHGRELTYRFDLNDAAWDSEPNDDYEIDNGADGTLETSLPLTTAMLAGTAVTGEGSRIRKVRVRVNAEGSLAVASAELILRNTAPIADAGEDLIVSRTLPLVTLDACAGAATPEACSSQDPDGDPLHYTWVGPPGIEPAALGTSGRFATFTPPPDVESMQFSVTADDGLASSRSFLSVHLGSQVWASVTQPTSVTRIFPDHRLTFTAFTTTAGGVDFSGYQETIAIDAEGSVYVGTSDPAPIVRQFDRQMNQLMEWTIPPFNAKNAFNFAHSAPGCVVSLRIGQARTFDFLMPDGSVVSREDTNLASGTGGARFVLPVENGGCWTIGSQVGRFLADGSWSARSTLALDGVNGAAVLSDGRVCVSGSDADSDDYGVWCIPSDSTATDDADFLLPFAFMGTLTAGPEGSLLGYSLDDGTFFRVDPVTGESAEMAGIGPFVFMQQETTTSIGSYNDLWLVDALAAVLHRYDLRGNEGRETARVRLDDVVPATGYDWKSLAEDPATGEAWALLRVQQPTGGEVIRFPWHARTMDRVDGTFTPGNELSADPTTGRVWVSDDGNTFIEGGLSVRTDRGRVVSRQPMESSEENWTFARARPNGGAAVLALRGAIEPTESRLLLLDAALGIEAEIDVPRFGVGMQLSPNGAFACVAGIATLFTSAHEFHGLRCDLEALTCTELQTPGVQTHYLDYAGGVRIAADDDGTCWFAALQVDGPPAQALFERIPGDATASALEQMIPVGDPFKPCTVMTRDPRDSTLWVLGGGFLTRYAPNGSTVDAVLANGIGCFDMFATCSDAGDPACLELWSMRGLNPDVVRSTGDPTVILETFDLNAGLFPQSLDVVR